MDCRNPQDGDEWDGDENRQSMNKHRVNTIVLCYGIVDKYHGVVLLLSAASAFDTLL